MSGVRCSLCKKEYHRAVELPNGKIIWASGSDFEYFATWPIKYHEGTHFGLEQHIDEKITIYLCPGCFKDKFIPWLKTLDAEVKIDTDF